MWTPREDLEYLSTKTYTHAQGLSCCFRQWRAESHCRFLHGYALEVKITFRALELTKEGWVQDFGGLKELKKYLEHAFDHKLLIAADDPLKHTLLELDTQGVVDALVVDGVGCEAFAHMIYNWVDLRICVPQEFRIALESVEVREHGANSAVVRKRS